MNKTTLLPLILIFLILNSCSDKKAAARAGILPEGKMTQVLVETHLADAILYTDESRADEKRDKSLFYYPSILEKYGITKAQMDSSVVWYMKHPEAYARIYENVVKDLDTRKAAIKKKETDTE